jgi:hypothetical protein
MGIQKRKKKKKWEAYREGFAGQRGGGGNPLRGELRSRVQPAVSREREELWEQSGRSCVQRAASKLGSAEPLEQRAKSSGAGAVVIRRELRPKDGRFPLVQSGPAGPPGSYARAAVGLAVHTDR